jgi:hypothetical protein
MLARAPIQVRAARNASSERQDEQLAPALALRYSFAVTDVRPVNDLVERGREAAARGSWREAYDLLSSVEPAELSPDPAIRASMIG